jgi:hypothetical protein
MCEREEVQYTQRVPNGLKPAYTVFEMVNAIRMKLNEERDAKNKRDEQCNIAPNPDTRF